MALENIHVPQTIKKAQIFSRESSNHTSSENKPRNLKASLCSLDNCLSIENMKKESVIITGGSLGDLSLLNPNPRF